MVNMAELDMNRNNTSILSRCKRMLSRREKPRRRESESTTTSSWPRPIRSPRVDVEHMDDDDCVQLLDTSCTKRSILLQRSRSSSRPLSMSRVRDQTLTIPPWCRLPSSTRFTTLSYVLFTIILIFSTASAAPLQHSHAHHLGKRQAIPDSFGNTGNKPAAVAPEPPPRVVTPAEAPTTIISISTSTSTTTTSTSAIIPSSSPRASSVLPSTTAEPTAAATLAPTTESTAVSTVSASVSASPSNPAPPRGPLGEQLQRTSPASPFTPGLIAGVAGGVAVIIALIIGFAFFRYRHSRRNSIQEIPIRRSRLGLRMFGSHREASRSPSAASKYTTRSSRRGSTEKAKQLEISAGVLGGKRSTFGSVSGWLDKGTIGRPKPAYVDTSSQFLELPRPLFADREKELERTEGAPWRPKRPEADAAPLGRLSGMGFGLGMGRASGMR